MAPTLTPDSTLSPPSVHNSPDTSFRVIRKRNRIPLSCAPCRHRKLKCNRGHPCDNCVRRSDIESCTYAAPASRKKSTASPANTTPDEMQNRIDRLEGLVLSLMTNGEQSAGPAAAAAALSQTTSNSLPADSVSGGSDYPINTDSSTHDDMEQDLTEQDPELESVSKSIGLMKVDGGKNFFISEGHWYSILAEISEVKNYFKENKKQWDESVKKVTAAKDTKAGGSTGLLFQNIPKATKAEIFRSFPSKQTTDKFIARFFEIYNFDPSFQIIHGPTYQKQYDRHFAAPHETDIMWLGLTFSMMMIALASYQRTNDEPEEYRGGTKEMLRDYKRLTAQSLMLVDLGMPVPYMLETLNMYTAAEIGVAKDAETSSLIAVTVIVRLAMKMGYHRDAKYFPDISPFQGEMRRRMWALVKHTDLTIAAQFGLPPIIRVDVCNTDSPRNLYDDELSEDLKVLPPSRPLTEATPIGYIVYKSTLNDVGYSIMEEVQKLSNSSYESIMNLDRKLREMHDNIPPALKMRAWEDSMRDPANLILKRFTLEIHYLKLVCYLHRKFSGCARYPYSKRTSVESAMEILNLQKIIFAEQRKGGRLTEKFYLCTLPTHDFLLAAMIVSMDLYRAIEAEKNGRSPTDLYESNTKAAKTAALESSLHMWENFKEESYEALKATGMLTAMLVLLREQESQLRSKRPPFQQQSYSAGTSGASPDDVNKLAPEHSAAMTLGLLSSGGSNGTGSSSGYTPSSSTGVAFDPAQQISQATMAQQFMSTNPTDATTTASPYSSLFGNVGNFFPMDSLPQNLDWDAWDSYMQNGNPMNPSMAATMWPMNLDPAMDPIAASPTGVTSSNANFTMTPGMASGNVPYNVNGQRTSSPTALGSNFMRQQ